MSENKKEFWKLKTGKDVLIFDLSDYHLQNAYDYLIRSIAKSTIYLEGMDAATEQGLISEDEFLRISKIYESDIERFCFKKNQINAEILRRGLFKSYFE